jgi:hypothetical protein
MTEIKKSKKKKEFNLYKFIKNSFIRRWTKQLYHDYNLKSFIIKETYNLLHYIYMFFIVFLIVFNTNIYHLFILLLIAGLDGFAIICLHECPMTLMEKNYVKESDTELNIKTLKRLNISYNCDHTYEQQLNSIIIVIFFIALKCLYIMYLNTFKIKLIDSSGIYS